MSIFFIYGLKKQDFRKTDQTYNMYTKLSNQVIQDLEMLGFDDAANDVRKLKTLHDKAIAPKKRRASKPRIPLKMLRLTITEGKRTSTLELDEKKAEAWMKAKQKDRAKQIKNFQIREGITPPSRHLPENLYYSAAEVYLAKINEAELNFEISIETL